jgi:hypothetical protein
MTQDDQALSWSLPTFPQDDRGLRIRALVPAAQEGDREALEELRGLLTPEEWRKSGDLQYQALTNTIRASVPRDSFLQESIFEAAAAKRTELLGPDPSPLERLLVERIVLCWVACHDADLKAAAWSLRGGETRHGLFHLRRQESAQRRLNAAIKALATVRRLLGPGMVQLNVTTGPQLNVAGAAPAPGASLAAAPSRE